MNKPESYKVTILALKCFNEDELPFALWARKVVSAQHLRLGGIKKAL